jgi:hypothetical protein
VFEPVGEPGSPAAVSSNPNSRPTHASGIDGLRPLALVFARLAKARAKARTAVINGRSGAEGSAMLEQMLAALKE